METACVRFNHRGDFEFLDERRQFDALETLEPCIEAHVGERAVDEITQTREATTEKRGRAAAFGLVLAPTRSRARTMISSRCDTMKRSSIDARH
jgi:hypothetical protein